jgi:FkbM family methyltransferase
MPKNSLFEDPIAYYKRKWYRHKFKHAKVPDEPVIKTLHGVHFRFDCSLGFGSVVKKMYLGIYEPHIVKCIRKHLKPADVYLDIGANIGYTAAIGAGRVGIHGQVHCFEPMPTFLPYLEELVRLNSDYSIAAYHFALGEDEGESTIETNNYSHIGLNTLVPGFIKPDALGQSYNVRVRRLDNFICEKELTNISLIKIDVEGYELQVLKGASGFFHENRDHLPSVIVEVNPSAYTLMKSSVEEMEDLMFGYGFKAYKLNGRQRIDIKKIPIQEDVLFKP